ncbi:hypothetical protein [Archaeoglobus veneficus]|uniref:Uncharacterized protein n=1 Tax=Archaeoglobus veneficus (strain DSM 11195 / SNP6) TaxID=693661 RepID=F2KR60_ARCVS|nr:hypothetical protein [Archaeoglobus veneficus]AEA46697.1 hypothetical protein Arcve_0677 [Archaeoglobus veneficus SNP6]
MWRRIISGRLPVILEEIPKVGERVGKGVWETLGGGIRYIGRSIGRPLAWGAAVGGAGYLVGAGVGKGAEAVREGLGLETPSEQLEKQLEYLRTLNKISEDEFRRYKEWLNMQRSAAMPGYVALSMYPPWRPEWTQNTKPSSADPQSRDWTLALPVVAAILVGLALVMRK